MVRCCSDALPLLLYCLSPPPPPLPPSSFTATLLLHCHSRPPLPLSSFTATLLLLHCHSPLLPPPLPLSSFTATLLLLCHSPPPSLPLSSSFTATLLLLLLFHCHCHHSLPSLLDNYRGADFLSGSRSYAESQAADRADAERLAAFAKSQRQRPGSRGRPRTAARYSCGAFVCVVVCGCVCLCVCLCVWFVCSTLVAEATQN